MTARDVGAGALGRRRPDSRGRFRHSWQCHSWRWSATVALTGLLASGLCGAVSAAAPPNAVKVQEDWVVEIGTPDPTLDGPQITTALSSTELLADVHMVFELNHRTLPDFNDGGMQLQCWSGDLQLAYKDNSEWEQLRTEGEVIRYTTSMRISGGRVAFDVLNGNSSTWGSFGTSGTLRVDLDTPQTNLDRYSPDVSVKNSRIGYGGHMVRKFYLKEVRYYDSSNNLILTDTTPRIVHDLALSGG